MPTEPLVCALVGHPIGRSLSPAMFAAAFEELGLPHRYELRSSRSEQEARAAFADVRGGALLGVNVTMPHKGLALASAEHASEEAALCSAANVLARNAAGQLVAHNTDALALAELLGRPSGAAAGRQLARGRGGALVVGAGGAALAAVWAAHAVGFEPVVATTRSWAEPSALESDPRVFSVRRAGGEVAPLRSVEDRFGRSFAVVVQATASGMDDDPDAEGFAASLPWGAIREAALAVDVVYRPRSTPFLRAASARGLAVEGGLEMLVLQASRAFAIWFEAEVPAPHVLRVESTMRRAALAASERLT